MKRHLPLILVLLSFTTVNAIGFFQSSQRPSGQVVGGIINSTEQAAAIRVDANGNVITSQASGTTVSVNIGSSGGTAVVSAGLAGALAIGGTVADGAASGATYPVVFGGVDGSGNVQRVLTDTGGAVQVDVESFPDNEPFNAAQINGVTPLMGNGVTGTGSQRVTIASDNTAFAVNATLQTGANTIGALTANQSVNVAQIAGTATVTAGVAGLQAVGGAAASGASASGNPIQIGIVYNTTRPTLTNGQVVQAQATSDGLFEVAPTPTIDGAVALSTAFTSTLGDTVFNIKTSQGSLYGYDLYNNSAAACWIQIFNVPAASVILGTTAPTLAIGMQTISGKVMAPAMALLNSANGISAASTTTAIGSTICATTSTANFFYR